MNNETIVSKVLAGVSILATLLPFVVFWGRMPEPMASQWSFSGAPVSALPRVAVLGIMLGLSLSAAFGLLRALGRAKRSPDVSSAVGACLALGLLCAELSWSSVLCNLDASGWSDAAPLPLPMVAAMLAGSAAAAVLGRRYARGLDRLTRAEDLPSAGVSPGHTAVFVGSVKAPLWSLGALVSVGLGFASCVSAHLATGVTLVAIGVVLALFSSLRVRVDRRGVRIDYGPFAWPRQRIALERIESATASEIRPMAHGGWGYRGSLTLMGRAAVIVRGGDALHLQLDGGKRFVVTVDDAATAAGLVNDLKARGA